ncbi:phage/plasmid primase, P4 family [Synechocystis sp. PCC 7509]|uniref:phage/plasmid primase, P4 family n=1 Tax=Synechocystis sp. PCC 7509 TaxID=927677 RepID=UPI0002ACDECB|nr:phage/plasmid primase, P4 family [Synechocystis sp. PCC 7509]
MNLTNLHTNNSIEANRANPCPLCDSDHWCFHLSEDAVICGKTDYAPIGWVKTGEAKDGRGIFAKENRKRRSQGGLPDETEILPLRLDPKTDSPQWVTRSTVGNEFEQEIEYLYPDAETGEPLGKVVRKQWSDRRPAYGRSGRDTKEIRPWHWVEPHHPHQGEKGWWSDRGKGSKQFPLYRQAEVREAIASGSAEVVFYVAGEQAVETARQLGLTSFCNQGGEGSYTSQFVDFLSANKPKLFVICPDNDETGRKSADKLLKACIKAGIHAIAIEPTNIWADTPTKGDITDIVNSSGMDSSEIIEQLEIEISRALLVRQNEPISYESTKKPPKPAKVARELAERYRHELAWNTSLKLWYRYSAKTSGVWSEIPDESVHSVVIADLECRPDIAGSYNFTFVSHTVSLMKAYLQVHDWHETPGLIPLEDGVLELATKQLLPHSPGYRLLWCLPYAWSGRAIGCQPIQNWMLEAMKGDFSLVKVFRAYLNAIATGRTDLQRYLECIGVGGSGKGTFTRLAMALVGAENTAVTTLGQLEKNRFETAGIFGKRLLLITDSERYGGEVSVLKAITGGDPVRYERKNVQQCKAFTPTCMVIVAANEPVQSGDYTSGLERRRLTLPFTHQVKPGGRRDLEKEFKPYLPGLLTWALEMPDEEVTGLLLDTSNLVRSLAASKAEFLIETNPMAEWLDACVVLERAAKTYVGVAQRDKSSSNDNIYLFTNKWLYASYCEYSAVTGSKAVSVRRFSTLLHDLCVSQLKLTGITKSRDNKGAYFEGLAIRHEDDERDRPISFSSPPPKSGKFGEAVSLPKLFQESEKLEHPLTFTESDGLKTKSDGLVTGQTLGSDGSDGSDGLFLSSSKDKNLFESELENQQENKERDNNEICHHFHHNPSLPIVPAITEPPLALVQSVTNPSTTPDNAIAREKSAVTEGALTLQGLAAQISLIQTWAAALELIDNAAIKTGKKRGTILKKLIKCFSQCDRVRFLALLDLHVLHNPSDERALKAQSVALCVATEAET